MKNKIVKLEALKKLIDQLRKKNKKIVHCHGVFDIVHIGHIKHFEEAKKKGDKLIVTVTTDKFVNKGTGRPIFKQTKRIEFLSQLSCIDYVCLSDSDSAIKLLKIIKPNYYIKGQDYKIAKKDQTGKITLEKKIVERNGGKIIFTNEETFSSSNIINNNFSYSDDQLKFLNNISKKYSFDYINKIFEKIKKLKVLVIGETIIDQYNFCEALGKSGKEPYLALKDIYTENYLGGAAAIANNLAEFCKKIKLVSMIGEKKEHLNFIKKKLHNKIDTTFFCKRNSPTILKKRFIDNITKSKLFGIYSINDDNISKKEDNNISKSIEKIISKFDLIIISDYGHGFISNKTALKICSKKKFIALNAQVNASNIGYHTLLKYKNINATIINETELRHEMRNKNDNIYFLSRQLKKKLKTKNLLVTRGKNGAILINSKNDKLVECPAYANNVVDRVGAGDSMLSIISLLIKIDAPEDLSLLLGSFAGAASVETIGNSTFLKKKNFLRHLEFALK